MTKHYHEINGEQVGCYSVHSPVIDAERLARAIESVAKMNPPHPALPVSRTIPEAAAAYAAEYVRLSESER